MRLAASMTDTLFVVHDQQRFAQHDTSGWEAIKAWCERHGIEPRDVLSRGPIHRDVERCRVVYVGRVDIDEPGPHRWSTCVQQGETPPLPWPPELERYRCESITPRGDNPQ